MFRGRPPKRAKKVYAFWQLTVGHYLSFFLISAGFLQGCVCANLLNMELTKFKNKKTLILGIGREGWDNLQFLHKFAPEAILGVSDRVEMASLAPKIIDFIKKHKIKTFFGKNYLSEIRNYDVIVKSPGIPIHLPEIEQAFFENKVISQTQIFFDNCLGTIIGVTGTKGKSTTSSLIYEVIRAGDLSVELLGNIGKPVLSYLESDNKGKIYVYELSAHQLYKLNKSPHISILTNLFPEHLDYYADYEEYIRAKESIAIHQTEDDYFIYNSENAECENIAKKSLAQKIAYGQYAWQFTGKTKLIGKFNLENAKIAAIVGRILNISEKAINKAIEGFEPLPHRLEFVGEYNGVKFYNDSLSTIQESAIAGIDAFGDDVTCLIAGGHERNQPFDKLAKKIIQSNINTLILFLPTGKRIWNNIEKEIALTKANRELRHFFVTTMNEAVDLSLKHAEKNKICLMSCASASFGNFKDYAQRGEFLKRCLQKLTSVN